MSFTIIYVQKRFFAPVCTYYYPWKANILLQKILKDAAIAYTMKPKASDGYDDHQASLVCVLSQ